MRKSVEIGNGKRAKVGSKVWVWRISGQYHTLVRKTIGKIDSEWDVVWLYYQTTPKYQRIEWGYYCYATQKDAIAAEPTMAKHLTHVMFRACQEIKG